MLACLIYVAVSSFIPGFNVGDIILTLFFIVPTAAIYAFSEYRYTKFKAKPENHRFFRGPNERLTTVTIAIVGVGVWAYFHRGTQDFPLMLLVTWAFIRAWYFIISSPKMKEPQPDKNA
jgi:hypothetical protein